MIQVQIYKLGFGYRQLGPDPIGSGPKGLGSGYGLGLTHVERRAVILYDFFFHRLGTCILFRKCRVKRVLLEGGGVGVGH